jgi:NADPH:quinone reductase-like Zn-dependent oxidoreductase
MAVGDRVFGATAPFKGGSFAEQAAVPATQLARLPEGMDSELAAALPIAGLAALYALRDLGKLQPGQRVLLHGATGAVGLYAVQIAKMIGATVVAVAGAGLQAAGSLGADTLIDYRVQHGTRFDHPFDVILNLSGKLPWVLGRRHLTPAGRFIEPSPTIPLFIGAMAANIFRRRKLLPLATAPKRADLDYLARLVGNGTLKVTIAATLPFESAKDAFGMMEKGGVVGKVVVVS